VVAKTNPDWVNSFPTWELDPDNTNTATLTDAAVGLYLNRAAVIDCCPSGRVLSVKQRTAGWTGRGRSYSMNAMVGDAGELT